MCIAPVPRTAVNCWYLVLISGASGSSQGIGASPQDPSEADEQEGEDALLDYVMEEVAGHEPTDNVRNAEPPGKDRYHG